MTTATRYGLWSVTDSIDTVQMIARAGFDYVTVDLQHGTASPADLRSMIAAITSAGPRAVVRVAWNRPELIMFAADAGAASVIVPMIETAAEAAAAVAATRFPPAGTRSWGPVWPSEASEPHVADARVACFVMIETAAGFAALEEIAAVPGLGGVYIGPNDLALGTGFGRSTYADEPQIGEMIDRIVDVCVANSITVGLHCSSVSMAAHWRDRGVTMLTAATDSVVFEHSVRSIAAELTGHSVIEAVTGY